MQYRLRALYTPGYYINSSYSKVCPKHYHHLPLANLTSIHSLCVFSSFFVKVTIAFSYVILRPKLRKPLLFSPSRL